MSYPICQARFLTSAPRYRFCPPDEGIEVAFCGRSNAGKSSAINAVAGQRQLARVSTTPGRTQQINFFEVCLGRRLVDLPGYGYAKVPVSVKRRWESELSSYLEHRRSLRGLILVSDVRRGLTEWDHNLLNWARTAVLPVHVIQTKADKLRSGAAREALRRAENQLADRKLFSIQLFSAKTGLGVATLREQLNEWLELSTIAVHRESQHGLS